MAKFAIITLQPHNLEPDSADVGALAASALEVAGHGVVRENLRADFVRIKGLLIAALSDPRFDGLILVGDLPYSQQEAIALTLDQIMERRLDGFAQVARQVLLAHEGASLVFSWFSAGSHSERLLLALPGDSRRLTRLLDELVVPQLTGLLEWAQG